jgi:heat shock protein HslJ
MRIEIGSAALVLALSACVQLPERVAPAAAPTATRPDAHTSQNSLDWAGTYAGIAACADCPGVKTSLTLNRDGTYVLVSSYLGRPAPPTTVQGTFAWQASGNAIALDEDGGGQQYWVREGSLAPLEQGAAPGASPPAYVLTRVVDDTGAAGASLVPTLEAHRWRLASAVDSRNRPIDALSFSDQRPLMLSFSDKRLNLEGGCNRIFGGFRIDAAGQLDVGRTASTNMACEPRLMAADTLLAGLLARPLQIDVDTSGGPRLHLVAASGETLVFTGEATPESRYGAPTLIFLEIAARDAACKHPVTGNTRCLQVRERKYDAQGLPVGAPGEWRPLYESIDGFTHVEGERNVLRVKRFTRPSSPPDGPATLYVLDLMIESESVAK